MTKEHLYTFDENDYLVQLSKFREDKMEGEETEQKEESKEESEEEEKEE